MRHPFWSN